MGSKQWIAKAELAKTVFFCSSVPSLFKIVTNILAASFTVSPPKISDCLCVLKPIASGDNNCSSWLEIALKLPVKEISY